MGEIEAKSMKASLFVFNEHRLNISVSLDSVRGDHIDSKSWSFKT